MEGRTEGVLVITARRLAVVCAMVVVLGACSSSTDAIANAETCAELEAAMRDAMEDMSNPTDLEERNEILALVLERRQELESRAITGNDTAEMESCATMTFDDLAGDS